MASDQYLGKVKHYFSLHREEMAPFVPNGIRTLLEVGCGTGAFASSLKVQRGIHVTGIEPQPSAAETASAVLDRVLALDVDAGLSELKGEKFDCVVFNDVLEHLVDPWNALTKVGHLLAPGGVVVASIPNIRYMPALKEFVIGGDWRYQVDGVMDRTHLRFFTRKSIDSLFASSGYRLQTVQGINGLTFPWKFALLNKLAGGRLDDTRYQQFACVAKLRGEFEDIR